MNLSSIDRAGKIPHGKNFEFGFMFGNWRGARYRWISAAIVLGCIISWVGASASATVLTDADTATSVAGNARVAPEIRGGETSGTPWSWLIIAALIGLAPLTIERLRRRKAGVRRYSRMDISMLETEVADLRALESLHRGSAQRLRDVAANVPGVVFRQVRRSDGRLGGDYGPS